MKILMGLGAYAPGNAPLEWAQALGRRGHDVEILYVRGGRAFPVRFYAALRRFRPEVVHVNHTSPVLSAALLGRRRSYVSLLTLHRIFSEANAVQRAVYGLGCRRLDGVAANSAATMQSVPRSALSPNVERRVVHNGVDLSMLDALRATKTASAVVRILTVGRLIPEKGHDNLLKAVAGLPAAMRARVHLTLIGGGAERPRIEALRTNLGLTETVTLTGMLPRDEVYRRLWQADLFVMPSLTEGFCNAVVEAMAAGIPVVSSPSGALPEVVGDAGLLAASAAPAALTVAIRGAVERLEELAPMAERGRARARGLFSLDATISAYERFYTDLLKRRGIHETK